MDFKWTDRVDGVDPASANDINTVAHAVEALNEEIKSLPSGGGGGGGGTSGNVPTKLSELEADSISRSDLNPFGFTVYIANFNAHEMNFGVDNLTFRNMGYGSGVNFDGNVIHGVGAPEADTDGVNKKYVDNAVKNVSGGSGGSATNVPTKVSQLENDAGYITNFVDEMNVTGTLHTQIIYGHEGIDINSEHTFIGSIDGVGIDFGGYNTDRNYGQIEGDMRVQTPENDQSIANKKYVDDLIGDVGTALDNIIALQNAKIEG